jgi:hypothetical protein
MVKTPFDDLIASAANRYGVPVPFALAIAQQESGYIKNPTSRAKVVSPKNAHGVMQMIPETGARYGLMNKADLTNPIKNIDAGVHHLSDLLGQFGGRYDLAAAAYNAGPNRASLRAGKVPAIPETQDYVKKVGGYMKAYGSTPILPQNAAATAPQSPATARATVSNGAVPTYVAPKRGEVPAPPETPDPNKNPDGTEKSLWDRLTDKEYDVPPGYGNMQYANAGLEGQENPWAKDVSNDAQQQMHGLLAMLNALQNLGGQREKAKIDLSQFGVA